MIMARAHCNPPGDRGHLPEALNDACSSPIARILPPESTSWAPVSRRHEQGTGQLNQHRCTGTLVWEMLVDCDAFPRWNPFITSAVQVGGRLPLRMQPVSGSAVTLRPTVAEVVDGQRLRWQGRLRVRGLFDADHLFIVVPRGAAGSRLVQQEQFNGLLVPFFQRSLDEARCRRSTR